MVDLSDCQSEVSRQVIDNQAISLVAPQDLIGVTRVTVQTLFLQRLDSKVTCIRTVLFLHILIKIIRTHWSSTNMVKMLLLTLNLNHTTASNKKLQSNKRHHIPYILPSET